MPSVSSQQSPEQTATAMYVYAANDDHPERSQIQMSELILISRFT